MDSAFLPRVKNYFTPEFQQQAGLSLDEETSAIGRALSALLPLGLAATIQRSEKDRDRINRVYNMANGAAAYVPASPDLAKLHNEEAGTALASDLFGSHEKPVRIAIAKYAGIKESSSGALMLVGIPVLMGSLGIYSKENNFSPDQLTAFLSKQKEAVKKDIPEGIRDVASIFGVSGSAVDEKHIRDAVRTDAVQPRNRGWVAPVIFVILAVLLLVYFSRGCNKPESDMESPNVDTASPVAMLHAPAFIH